MPEERKIEKLLRAVAKRRREQSGEPFQMHPATRNLLQREISQRAKASPPKETFLTRIFSLPKPRLVFAMSALAIVAIGVALLVPALTKNKEPLKLAKSHESIRQLTETKPRIGAS